MNLTAQLPTEGASVGPIQSVGASSLPRVRRSCARCHRDFTNGGFGAQSEQYPDLCRDCANWTQAFGRGPCKTCPKDAA